MEPHSSEPVAQVVADRIAGDDEAVRRRAQREVIFDTFTLAISALVVGTNAFESVPVLGHAIQDLIHQIPPVDGLQISPEHVVNTMKIGTLFLVREGARDAMWMFTAARRADIFKRKLRMALREQR